MSILDKIFKKQTQVQANTPTPTATQPQAPSPATVQERKATLTAETILKEMDAKMPNERIAYYFEIKENINTTWTAHQKAYLYYLVACAAEAGMADEKYRNSNLSLAFYAAQLFHEPDRDSSGWTVFERKYGFMASKENAATLHSAYPLPQTMDEAQNYKVAAIYYESKEEPQQTDKVPSKNIRHIVCLCYDAPYINSLKPQMQDFIINAEQQRGSVITQTSRITFDSFYDNGDLEKPDMLRQKLEQIYCQVYKQSKMYELADITVSREVQQKDGHTLVKYFVLYE